jgi:inosose dehydratase
MVPRGEGLAPIRVANAPCSWGVLEFGLEGGAEGAVAGCRRVLDEMAEAGYLGTEFGDWGFMPTEAGALRQVLAQRRLSMVGAFVPVALADAGAHAAGEAAALRVAKLLAEVEPGAVLVLADDNGKVPERTRNAGRIRRDQGLPPDAWQTFARGAERIARAVRDATGLRAVFHHHCAGYIETPEEVQRLMELTDPALLGLCLDTGHYGFGGGDTLKALREFGERVWHVHFKDCDPRVAERSRAEAWDYFASVKNGIFCELGKGSVPFDAVVRALRGREYHGWVVVEQDVLPGMGTPLQSARRNRQFLKTVGL